MFKFPGDFYWGAAASAHQVEGDNQNSEWWEWEIKAGLADRSGRACRHYELYEQDFDLAKQLHHNAHRLSVEWARIEPEPGKFSGEQLEHYRGVILALAQRGIEPIVTLHHFTNPLWFARLGGWKNRSASGYFLRFVEKITEVLADKVRFWVTINEPMVYVYHSYILGAWPPQEKSLWAAGHVTKNLARGHIRAYRLIHKLYRKKGLASPSVSIAKNMQAFEPGDTSLKTRLAVRLRRRWFNFAFIETLLRARALDFIGLNYYTRSIVRPRNWSMRSMLIDTGASEGMKKNSLGWDIFPDGLYELLISLKKYRLPVFILENGICTADDSLRWEFIRAHLEKLAQAMRRGAQVIGYIYWSLLDNFEWDKGFAPRFGLIEVDYQTYNRSIRESAVRFAQVAKTGIL